jgi:hypothetical protein
VVSLLGGRMSDCGAFIVTFELVQLWLANITATSTTTTTSFRYTQVQLQRDTPTKIAVVSWKLRKNYKIRKLQPSNLPKTILKPQNNRFQTTNSN